MICVPSKKDIPDLTDVWRESFGDSEDYISLFFDREFDFCEPLCFRENNRAVSALYRLPCEIAVQQSVLSCRYIYAAATLNEYRSQGIMSKLLEESIRQAQDDGIDCLALVPGESSLADYYSRFGFTQAMSRKKRTVQVVSDSFSGPSRVKRLDSGEAYVLRSELTESFSRLKWGKRETEYAIECARFFGGGAFEISGCFALCVPQGDGSLTITELLGDNVNTVQEDLLGFFGVERSAVFGPSDGEMQPFGMALALSPRAADCITDNDIYMNLAFD